MGKGSDIRIRHKDIFRLASYNGKIVRIIAKSQEKYDEGNVLVVEYPEGQIPLELGGRGKLTVGKHRFVYESELKPVKESDYLKNRR